MGASFEEKSVWIQLLGLTVGLGTYFIIAAWMLAQGVTVLGAYVPLFIAAVVLLVVVLIAGYLVAAITSRPSRPEPRDERDRLIEWRAESNASWILGAGAFTAIVGLIAGVGNVWIAHLLMHSLMLSQVAKLGFQLLYYRRGMGA